MGAEAQKARRCIASTCALQVGASFAPSNTVGFTPQSATGVDRLKVDGQLEELGAEPQEGKNLLVACRLAFE